MAEIVIKITDKPGGKVSVEITPNFETLMKKNLSGNDISSAEAYGLLAVRSIREESKRQGPTLIDVPRIIR